MGYYFLGYIATFLDIRPIWAQKQDTLERFRVKKAQSWGIKSHNILTRFYYTELLFRVLLREIDNYSSRYYFQVGNLSTFVERPVLLPDALNFSLAIHSSTRMRIPHLKRLQALWRAISL